MSSLKALITQDVIAKAVIGKEAAMARHGLHRFNPSPVYSRTSKGTDAEASGTQAMYELRWSHFHLFCILVGQYTCSLVLDRERCPDRPIPVEPNTIRLYLSYMTFDAQTELVDPDTKRLI